MKTLLLVLLTAAALAATSTPASARDWCGYPSYRHHYSSYSRPSYWPGYTRVGVWPYSYGYSYYRSPSYSYYAAPAPAYYYSSVRPSTYYGSHGGSYSTAAGVQYALAREGYYHGAVDGIIGPQSHSAICRYQADHGLRVTGCIDNALLSCLGLY